MAREVAGDIAAVKKYLTVYTMWLWTLEKRDQIITICLFLCFYTLCAKCRFIIHGYILQSGPLPQFSPVLIVIFCASPCSGAYPAHPCLQQVPSLNHTRLTPCWTAPGPATPFRSLTVDHSLKSMCQDLSTHFLCLFAFLNKPSEFIKTSKNKKQLASFSQLKSWKSVVPLITSNSKLFSQ